MVRHSKNKDTKLKREDGTICTSNERPDILADHYEHKQWAMDPNRDKENPNNKLLETRSASGRTTINEDTKVETGPFTVEEI